MKINRIENIGDRRDGHHYEKKSKRMKKTTFKEIFAGLKKGRK